MAQNIAGGLSANASFHRVRYVYCFVGPYFCGSPFYCGSTLGLNAKKNPKLDFSCDPSLFHCSANLYRYVSSLDISGTVN